MPTLSGLRGLWRTPERILGGLVRETTAVLTALHALPRLTAALEQIAADSAHTRGLLQDLARDTRHLAPTLGQLRALHEQVVAIACDLRALEPEIEGMAGRTAAMDRSISQLAEALHAGAERR